VNFGIYRASMGRRARRVTVALGAVLLAAALSNPGSAAAQSSNIGAGAYTGSIAYNTAIPRLVNSNTPPGSILEGEDCVATTFSIQGTTPVSAVFVLNTALSGYLGTLSWSGTGSSDCETALGGSGTIRLTSVSGVGPTNSKISCASTTAGTTLTGGYTRTATDFEAVLGGTCTLNANPPSFPGFPARVLFVLRGEWEPEDGKGVTTSTTDALIEGAILVQPA
jgi:hypothetical protein